MSRTTAAQRAELARVMDFMVANASRIHYPPGDIRHEAIHTVRTMAELAARLQRPQGLTIDCSQAVELVFHVAGLLDPDHAAYTIDGFTGTLLRQQPHYVKWSNAGVGAIGVLGPGTGDHAVIVRHPGADPVVFSHGQEAGPMYLPLSVEAAAHRPPVTLISIASLG